MDEALHEEADTAFIGDGIISVFGAPVAFEESANRRDVRPDLTSIASNVPARAVSALPMVVRARPFSTAGTQKRLLADGVREAGMRGAIRRTVDGFRGRVRRDHGVGLRVAQPIERV
jgi:hypothetical protein